MYPIFDIRIQKKISSSSICITKILVENTYSSSFDRRRRKILLLPSFQDKARLSKINNFFLFLQKKKKTSSSTLFQNTAKLSKFIQKNFSFFLGKRNIILLLLCLYDSVETAEQQKMNKFFLFLQKKKKNSSSTPFQNTVEPPKLIQEFFSFLLGRRKSEN